MWLTNNRRVKYLLNVRIHAINKSIQNILSNGITSVPLKYRPNGITQKSVKLIKPIIVNENAIIGTGGSPITFRNITYTKNICKRIKREWKIHTRTKHILTLNTAYAAPDIVAKTTPPNVGLPVMPSM